MKHSLVLLATFSNDIDAELAKGHVESAGIEAIVVKDDAGGMIPSLQESGGVKVMVNQNDVVKATKILQEKNLW